MTAPEIVEALYAKYRDPNRYIAIDEFRPGTGYGVNSERFFDFYVIDCYGPCNATAFEVKVSRSDFLSELKKPEKRRLALHFSHEYYFVAPQGLIKPEELPTECGLMEARQEDDRIVIRQKRASLHRDTARPSWRFVASIARSTNKTALGVYAVERRIMGEDQRKLIKALRDCYGDIGNLNAAMEREGIKFQTPPHITGTTLDISRDIRPLPNA